MERDSRKIIKRLEKDGWTLVRVKGSHHHFEHASFADLITVPHPKKNLSIGVVRNIYGKAGWR